MSSSNTAGGDVVAAVDNGPSGETLVIADVSRDGVWLSAPLDATAPLAEWC